MNTSSLFRNLSVLMVNWTLEWSTMLQIDTQFQMRSLLLTPDVSDYNELCHGGGDMATVVMLRVPELYCDTEVVRIHFQGTSEPGSLNQGGMASCELS